MLQQSHCHIVAVVSLPDIEAMKRKQLMMTRKIQERGKSNRKGGAKKYINVTEGKPKDRKEKSTARERDAQQAVFKTTSTSFGTKEEEKYVRLQW